MTNVVWQTKSQLLYDAFQNRSLPRESKGGRAYEYWAAVLLSEVFNLTFDRSSVRESNENLFSYLARVKTKRHPGDIYIMDPFLAVMGKKNRQGKTVVIIHHIDVRKEHGTLLERIFLSRLKSVLKKYDYIITVSQHWHNYMLDLGVKRVKIIYNAFDLSEFEISKQEINAFKAKYNFEEEKPIIYIGNASKDKGVVESYQALRKLPYQLVMSGPKQGRIPIPVRNLDLNRSEYLKLLKSCEVVIAMSSMPEGWNRTCHEAMLCRTPVIGSGSGGMKELLVGGEQIIADNYSDLPNLVNTAIEKKGSLREMGYRFASKFNFEYFKNSWTNFISEILQL